MASELCPIAADTAESGGVNLGPKKLFLPVFCRTDHYAPFEHHRFAWISEMASWRPVLQVPFRRIKAALASELCPIAADMAESGGVILGPTKLFLPVFCRADYLASFEHPRFAWISKIVN